MNTCRDVEIRLEPLAIVVDCSPIRRGRFDDGSWLGHEFVSHTLAGTLRSGHVRRLRPRRNVGDVAPLWEVSATKAAVVTREDPDLAAQVRVRQHP